MKMKITLLIALLGLNGVAFANSTGSHVSPDQVEGQWSNEGDCVRSKTGVVVKGPHEGELYQCIEITKFNPKKGTCGKIEQLFCQALED